MGSSSSKDTAAAADGSTVAASSSGRARSIGRKVFRSACLGLPQVMSDEQDELQSGRSNQSLCMNNAIKSSQANQDCGGRLKFCQSLSDYNVGQNVGNQENTSHTDSDASSSTTTQSARVLNPSTRSRSHFDFFRDGLGFRLGRAASLGSADSNAVFSRSFSLPYAEGGHPINRGSDGSSENRSRAQQDSVMAAISSMDVPRHNAGSDNFETRRSQRRFQEPLEGTARFSRTLSVGRLRERVLRRTSFPDGRFGPTLSEDRSLGHVRQGNARQFLSGVTNVSSSDGGDDMLLTSSASRLSSIPRTTDSSLGYELEATQLRESGTQDTLEHRSAFIERRRRIRSQVRALQRLGSRFENLSGHDRSCILSGQHRSGHCACRTNNQGTNPGDDTSTRASISRIVMLAEALFEVLDEIHQQAMVLASRPSLSSIGSVPAPKEVVDCMPVKIYTKSEKHQNDEAAQCYICLVEYEEGDFMRVLPCRHEFHRTCVDKWLKEIHRVCPLCRGDVCISDVSHMDELD